VIGSGFLDLPAELRDPARSRYRVIPVPYDATSTWQKGAQDGPAAMIDASGAIEWYDIETESEPCAAGVHTEEPIICDGPPTALEPLVRDRVADVFRAGAIPVVLGGEHSVSIGAINAAADAFDDVTVLQIDAHADTRESYKGSTHNHACVMARARERAPILQVGIRAIDVSERAGLSRERTVFAYEIAADPTRSWVEKVTSALSSRTYLTFDLDAFDPSVVPATGTPEPGGMSWYDAVAVIDAVARVSEIVGFDVVELCPRPGQHASAFVAAKLVYRIMAAIEAAGRR